VTKKLQASRSRACSAPHSEPRLAAWLIRRQVRFTAHGHGLPGVFCCCCLAAGYNAGGIRRGSRAPGRGGAPRRDVNSYVAPPPPSPARRLHVADRLDGLFLYVRGTSGPGTQSRRRSTIPSQPAALVAAGMLLEIRLFFVYSALIRARHSLFFCFRRMVGVGTTGSMERPRVFFFGRGETASWEERVVRGAVRRL